MSRKETVIEMRDRDGVMPYDADTEKGGAA